MNQALVNRFYGSAVYHWAKEHDKSFCSLVTHDNFIIVTGEDTEIEDINIQSELMALVKCNGQLRSPYRAYCSGLPDILSLVLLSSIGVRELYYFSYIDTCLANAKRLCEKLSVNLIHLEYKDTDNL